MNKLNVVGRGYSFASNLKDKDLKYRYQLLGRLQSDCDYYLRNPNPKHLWSGDVKSHIEDMKELYNSFKGKEKPQWITWNDILKYEKEMKKLNVTGVKEKKAFGDSVIGYIVDERKLIDAVNSDFMDEQTQDLLGKVYEKLNDRLKLTGNEFGALNRMKTCVERGKSQSSDAHRNQIFKAANALGIKLPSSAF